MSQQALIGTWLVKLVDPFLAVDPKIKKRLEQVDLEAVRRAFWCNITIWPILYILHFHFNDQHKQPLELYFKYRYGMAAGIVLLGFAGRSVYKSALALRGCLVTLAIALCMVQSWSMTLGPYISHTYLIWLPLIVVASFSRSFIFSAILLSSVVYASKIFWAGHTEVRFIFSDTTIALFILFGLHLVRRVWIDARSVALVNDDLRREAFVAQQVFDKQIRTFISPVLIQNIETMTSKGINLIAAIDSVLQRRKTTVAVLFSDMRNFSSRSDDIDFVEKELIPSARSIIDNAEQNRGVAKQIGDAVFVYYALEDNEESLLRGVKDGMRCSLEEEERIRNLGRRASERFFTLTYGLAFVGNMASAKHREATIIGSPANLAARIDGLTKHPQISKLISDEPGVLLSASAFTVVGTFSPAWQYRKLNLLEAGIEIRSYREETDLYFLSACSENLGILEELLKLNQIPPIANGETNGKKIIRLTSA